MDKVNITIIGAGVIGLAAAAELSKFYSDIIVIEKNDRFGLETSSRNSEVVHAGIYYPEGSLKAELCVKGSKMLYDICDKHSVPYKKTGKIITAIDESERAAMEELYNKGLRNGAGGLRLIEQDEIKRIEPMAKGIAAIYSGETGIIDSYSLMKTLYNMGKSNDVLYAFKSEVDFIEKNGGGYTLGINGGESRLKTDIVINCAGLYSDNIASIAGINIDEAGYRLKYTRGSYFGYNSKSPVKMLVYPLPMAGLKGLGVHATVDMSGRLRFGPDTENITGIDYTVDESKIDFFFESACRIITGIEREHLVPELAGIRPKLGGDDFRDFVIEHEQRRGLDGLINLIGIESPGLTSSIAIAERIRNLINEIRD